MENNRNAFGLDIGITSIGAAIINESDVKYLGVRMFNQAKEAKEARLHRSARRNLSRKKWRKKELKKAFSQFELISENEFKDPDFSCFTAKSESFKIPEDKTVYHLRKRALTEKVTEREMFLCFLNILQARGHFNMEMYDFSKETITFDGFKERFYHASEPYFSILENERDEFEKNALFPMFECTANKKTISQISKHRYTDDNEEALTEMLSLLCGYKAKINKISDSFVVQKDSVNIINLKSEEILDEFFLECIDLFDMKRIHVLLKDCNYLCEKAVQEIDQYDLIANHYSPDSEKYKEYMKGKKDVGNNKKHIRSWRNIENNYPNGLYLKEVRAILNNQRKYYPQITDEFIEIIISIVSARIPYYVGPLSSNGKNAWVVDNDHTDFEYSYAYTQKNLKNQGINELESITEWKKRMISHCTYLPEEYALPQGSFLAETFSILNEMNILTACDENDRYYLTLEDKIRIFDELFLKKEIVTYKDVTDLLKLKSFGTRKNNSRQEAFNNKFTVYHSIRKIDPSLKLDSIMDIFDEPDKIGKIEDIILSLNLYDEESSKWKFFEQEYGYSSDIAKHFSMLSSKGFYSFSKKFIYQTTINRNGDTIISHLFKDNSPSFVNEQMTLIANAEDANGDPIDFISNKYVRKLKKNGGKLDISLIVDNGTPVIPMSRPVIRALNECMKMYTEMVKVYGVPKRVVIETARDFKDHTEIGSVPERRYKKTEDLYNYLLEQIKEKKLYDGKNNIEEWNAVKEYIEKNALKIELYIRQNGTDLLTGERINLHNLSEYEVDHILPRGFGDDSRDDKMLVSRIANAKKQDRLPLQFLESEDGLKGKLTVSEYLKRVEQLFDAQLISEKKYKMLTLETASDLDNFINQNIVDTRYIIREFMSILNAYNTINGYDTHIVALKSVYTSVYRKAFDFDKNRDFGDQHHAYDAAIVLIADKTLSTMYPNYDRRKPSGDNSSFATYQGFIKAIADTRKNENADTKEKAIDLKRFIKLAYYKAFNHSADLSTSLISKIKDTVPFYSVKTERNWSGQFFEATILPQKDNKMDAPLSILGVNDEKKVFSGIECAAVDFYKFTNKKGIKEHLAVHIPKVIISSEGVIDKEKYLKLIRDYYKKPELLDENGELKEYLFRFRVFRNDIIYDTVLNCPTLFNIGSMVNKKTEKKFINIFSYNQIYKRGEYFRHQLIRQFNIKTASNKDGVPYNMLNKRNLAEHAISTLWSHPLKENAIETVLKACENTKNIYDLGNLLSYLELCTDRKDYPPTITGQYAPVVNPVYMNKKADAQYVKLKYNILGIKFETNENGKLIIASPFEIGGSFKKITKEEFSWKISKELL